MMDMLDFKKVLASPSYLKANSIVSLASKGPPQERIPPLTRKNYPNRSQITPEDDLWLMLVISTRKTKIPQIVILWYNIPKYIPVSSRQERRRIILNTVICQRKGTLGNKFAGQGPSTDAEDETRQRLRWVTRGHKEESKEIFLICWHP